MHKYSVNSVQPDFPLPSDCMGSIHDEEHSDIYDESS